MSVTNLRREIIARAANLFRKFQGRLPAPGELREISQPPTASLEMGKLDGVIYTCVGDGKKYIHRFGKSRRPVLYASYDGKQLFILAGEYRLTERGLIG